MFATGVLKTRENNDNARKDNLRTPKVRRSAVVFEKRTHAGHVVVICICV